MNSHLFKKTFKELKTENGFYKAVGVVLSVALLICIISMVSKDEIIILQPVTLGEDAWVTSDNSSQSYKEAWGFWMATLVGNVTPESVSFIKERVGPLLSPMIYNEVIAALQAQAAAIREDSITMRFEPKYVEYELETNKVFIYGSSFVKGQVSEEERVERTYEYEIKINNYGPSFVDMDTYSSKPKTIQFLEKEMKK